MIRRCDVSSLVDDECKGCFLCSSELHDFIIFCINISAIIIQSLDFQIRISNY